MGYKLICFDLDGVIFECSNFWMELHKRFETYEKGKELTKKYLHTDYERLVDEVVQKLWKGRNTSVYNKLVNSIKYLEGARELFDLLQAKDYITVIISASSLDLAKRAQHDLGIDYVFANELVIRDDKITGEFIFPVGVGYKNKADILKDLCNKLKISLDEVIYIGDADNDIEAFKIVDKAIAFNSSSDELKQYSDIVVDSDDLRDLMEFIK